MLYGESSNKKRKLWVVSVEDRDSVGVIITTHGYEDGKKVVNERVVASGKNLGRINATTPVTQAIAEAQGLWNKKRDAGYSPEGLETTSDFAPPLPMLAHDYNKRKKDMKFPCFAQRKLDGVRCIAAVGQGLFSRNGKPLSPLLGHIVQELQTLPSGVVLDGELYSDTLSFQEIVGLVKRKVTTDADTVKARDIYLCAYDQVLDGKGFEERYLHLQSLIVPTLKCIRLLETVVCASEEDLKRLHSEYVSEGYEGIILRNKRGLYNVSHRSVDLQKYKEFEDAEYEVTGFKEGDGTEKGCVIWICRLPSSDVEFAVRPRGTHDERARAFLTASSMIGKKLNVRYQELTDDGLPRFPVGICFRDYE